MLCASRQPTRNIIMQYNAPQVRKIKRYLISLQLLWFANHFDRHGVHKANLPKRLASRRKILLHGCLLFLFSSDSCKKILEDGIAHAWQLLWRGISKWKQVNKVLICCYIFMRFDFAMKSFYSRHRTTCPLFGYHFHSFLIFMRKSAKGRTAQHLSGFYIV